MAWYLLTRLDASLVTVDLANDDQIVLVFDDYDEAVRVGTVIDGESPVDPVGIATFGASEEGLEAPPLDGEQLRTALKDYAAMRPDLKCLKPLLPGDDLHGALVRMILRR